MINIAIISEIIKLVQLIVTNMLQSNSNASLTDKFNI